MIQRIQSIWLLLAALSMVLTFFIPYGIQNTTALNSLGITETDLTAKSDLVLTIIVSFVSVFCFALIFIYNNRKLQMRLCLLGTLLAAAVAGYQLFDASQITEGNKLVLGILGSKIYLGVLVPVISIIFLMLAHAGIKRDENLIRSADRLR